MRRRGSRCLPRSGARAAIRSTDRAASGRRCKGLFGSKVELTNGKTVTADDAYLLEAIEDPRRRDREGLPAGIMSGVIKPHQVAESDARDLIAYIKTLK